MAAPALERIAHYRIVRRVGRGGMGVVYQAVDERDDKTVALKVIRDVEVASEKGSPHAAEARVRFEREAEILRSLLHANVVTFHEIGEDDGTPYLAMEFLEGRPLGTFSGRPYPETLPLLIQAANGMEYLASRGIVHRDLSPDNIFVVDQGGTPTVKLLDFGIAKLFEASESLTATGLFLGKVAYGSPEQLGYAGHGAPLDWRSDVYSLGVIFFQVLSGHRPFEAKAPVEYIAAHLNHAPPPVAAPPGAPALPMDLVRLIAQMLAKKREDRPATYREITDRLVAALRAAVDAPRAEPGATVPSLPRPLTAPTSLVGTTRPERRRRWLVAGAGLAGAGLLAFLSGGVLERLVDRDEPAAPSASRPRAVPLATEPRRELRITAAPPAEVVAVVDAATGRPLALPAARFTPFVLPVPPGTYRVDVAAGPPVSRQASREVTVRPGEDARLDIALLSPDELVETLR